MSNEPELKARDKVVLRMTREGAVEENLTAGTEQRVSKRPEDAELVKPGETAEPSEALSAEEQKKVQMRRQQHQFQVEHAEDNNTQPPSETSVTEEKRTENPPQNAPEPLPSSETPFKPPVLEQHGVSSHTGTVIAETVVTHKLRKTSAVEAVDADAVLTQAAETASAKPLSDDAVPPTKRMQKLERKSEKAHERLDAAREKLPTHNVLKKERVFDEETGKGKTRLHFEDELKKSFDTLREKCQMHPELFGVEEGAKEGEAKTLLDALYEEGIIPTYSFPKNVVSTYIPDTYGKILYEVDRGLDVAIGEYAPGRAIVVDKQTYQIGGFYYPGSERRHGQLLTPARAYTEDPNYVKPVISCPECGWFGLMEEKTERCPFCGNSDLKITREMMRPWGFAPRNAESMPDVQLSEEYTAVQQPLYSTLPEAEEMNLAPGCKNIRIASRTNQRIIMLNKGLDDKGFMVCKDCGAAMPGDDVSVLNDINRPYKSKFVRSSKCRHRNCFNVNLGYDFITDMLVLEFTIDDRIIDVRRNDNPWLNRAAQSLAEALRLVASKKLDIEFAELVTGYRLRTGSEASYVDIYLYDSLSSGAGYAVSVADAIAELLTDMKELLSSCNCGSACSKCLKHYRNQYVHGMLDRFTALQLLEWGVHGVNASPIKPETQIKMIMPLANILKQSGCEITSDGEIIATGRRNKKRVVVYPAMWVEPHAADTIFVSDAYIKYAKPYAVQKILDNI